MATMLESLRSSLTPETLGSLGNALGLDPELVNQGMNVVGPVVQGGMANAASTPQGLEGLTGALGNLPDGMADNPLGSIMGMLGGGGGLGGMLGGLGGMLGGGSAQASGASGGTVDLASALFGGGGGMLGGLINSFFGDGISAIGKTLSKKLGFDVTPLLAAGLPLLLGMLKKRTKSEGLDSAALARTLQTEQQAFLDAGGPEADMVKEAMEAGKKATGLRRSFSDEEWSDIRLAPLAVAGLVMAASPSRWGGAAKELGAGVQAVTSARDLAEPTSVVGLAFDHGYSDEELQRFTDGVNKQDALGLLSRAVGTVASRAAGDADGFRMLLQDVGNAVASASKEGGFLGFGGKTISDAEAAVLREIAAAVNR